MLKIKNLNAGYENLQILKDINIEVGDKDLAIIIGPNGSGKSTAVKSVFGLTTRFSGKISFNGNDLTKLHTHQIVKLGIGYVPQGRLVFDSLTVEENLIMGGYNLTKNLVEKRKEKVLKLYIGEYRSISGWFAVFVFVRIERLVGNSRCMSLLISYSW